MPSQGGSVIWAPSPSAGPGTAEDVQELFVRWQRDGDRGAREALVERFLPLARSLARRYGRSAEPFEDLLQVPHWAC